MGRAVRSTIAIIGAGKVGSAMIKALKQCFPSLRIIATGRSKATLLNARSLGAEATRDNNYAVSEAEFIILSVKPHHFPIVAKQVKSDSWRNKVVVSVMAGIRLNTLKRVLKGSEVYRAMPNINIVVRKSSTAITDVKGKCRDLVNEVFECFGRVYWVPEEYLDIWSGLAGSDPTFIAKIVDALVLGAVASGMPRDLAYKAILDVLEGTTQYLRSNPSLHPAEMRDAVTTPAETTIRGLMTMESRGVKAALKRTVEATYRRSVRIGKDIDEYVKEELSI